LTELNLNIASNYDAVTEVNKTIRKFLADESVEEHICNAVDICLSEGLNNIIKHSYGGDQFRLISITVKKDPMFLELQMVDEGKPRENLVVNDLDFDPGDIENLPESGMGLFIIKQLMDEMNYYSLNGKNYFILKKWFY
jgi:serine/threonine-protein kinase RsbW